MADRKPANRKKAATLNQRMYPRTKLMLTTLAKAFDTTESAILEELITKKFAETPGLQLPLDM